MSQSPLSFAQLASQFQTVRVGTLLWLRKSKMNKTGLAPIQLRIFIGADRIEHSSGIRVAPDQWDAETGRILGKGKAVQQQNEQLQLLTAHVTELVNLMKATGRKVTIKSLRQQLMAPTVGKSPCFIEVCQQATVSRDKLNPTAHHSAVAAIQALIGWRGRQRHTDLSCPLPVDEFTPKLAAEFYHWLSEGKKLKTSSANNIISRLVGLFRYAAEIGEVEIGDTPFRALRKKKAAPAAQRLHLSLAQLAELRAAPLTGKAALARDMYLAQYYLHGSRVGAVLLLRWQQIGADSITFQAEKGGPRKCIAISPDLARLLATGPLPPRPPSLFFPACLLAFSSLRPTNNFRPGTRRCIA